MSPVRIRLLFEDRHMLNKSHKKQGLKRSWIHLKPHHKTIADFASHIARVFHLDDSCPNGFILSMDGFVLPLFESSCVLKDKDLICVKKKNGTLCGIIKQEIVEKQPLAIDLKLLANEEFEKGTRGHESKSEEEENQANESIHLENGVSKKRKACAKLRSSEKKKKKRTNNVSPDALEGDDDIEREVLPVKTVYHKHKSSDLKVKPDKKTILEIGKLSDDIGDTKNNKRRFHLPSNNSNRSDEAHVPDENKKLPSRSARRKKAKRQWLRQLSMLEKKELNHVPISEKDNHHSPEKDNHHSPEKVIQQLPEKDNVPKVEENHIYTKQQDQSSDGEEEVFPVMVRPGHIRFETLGKDSGVQQSKNQISVDNFLWNGITSKKKGQKWGKEKCTYSGRSNSYDHNEEVSEMLIMEEEVPSQPLDYDQLMVYTALPERGDVIAYRLIELSSSWCPEVSPFRVGKISQYDPETNKVRLESVPQYPLIPEEKLDEEENEFSPQLDTSLYGEDGSLEIEFSSLIDVRTIKNCKTNARHKATATTNETHVDDKIMQVSTQNGTEKKDVKAPENDGTTWDEINEALSAKKAQLSQQDGWNKQENSSHNKPFRVLRGCALGPTMAILRAQNEI